MDKPITRKQAEAVLDAVKAQHAGWLEPILREDGSVLMEAGPGPVLVEGYSGHWAIAWEEGPDEWVFTIHGGSGEEDRVLLAQAAEEFGGDVDTLVKSADRKAAKIPAGVYVEPVNHVVLGLYPA